MALVCNRVSKINKNLKGILSKNMINMKLDNILDFNTNLTSSFHAYNNLKTSNLYDNSKAIELEKRLYGNILTKLTPQENLGKDLIYSIFKSI